jgi:hypothetical protein
VDAGVGDALVVVSRSACGCTAATVVTAATAGTATTDAVSARVTSKPEPITLVVDEAAIVSASQRTRPDERLQTVELRGYRRPG